MQRSRFAAVVAAAAFSLTLASCSPGTPGQPGAQGESAGTQAQGSGPVIASPIELGGYSPLASEGQYGQSMLYDGLLAMESTGSESVQKLVPALATGMPTPNDEATVWTVGVRDDVRFSNDQPLTSADVKATYDALLDPDSASEIRSYFEMIDRMEAPDATTVVFHLKHPYSEFPSRLLMAIAPADLIKAGTAADQSLNTEPVGTGPYRLAELNPDRAVFEANPEYFGGSVSPEHVTYVFMGDDNTRAQRIAAGEVEGAVLPPALAQSITGSDDNLQLFAAATVDFRGIALPRIPFTDDVVARKAMNQAVDREGFVTTVLSGHGQVAHTPIPPVAGNAYEPSAAFTHDVDAAKKALDDAGWVTAADGIRAKGNDKAEFTIYYDASDTLRGQVATAFAADMKQIGVQVDIEGTTWDGIESAIPNVGYVQGGGSYAMSIDALAFDELHTRLPDASSPYNNPGSFGNAQRDALLDEARKELDEGRRAELYRKAQLNYLEDPGAVFIAFPDHTYVKTKDSSAGLTDTDGMVLEPHIHSSNWGPWWNLGRGGDGAAAPAQTDSAQNNATQNNATQNDAPQNATTAR